MHLAAIPMGIRIRLRMDTINGVDCVHVTLPSKNVQYRAFSINTPNICMHADMRYIGTSRFNCFSEKVSIKNITIGIANHVRICRFPEKELLSAYFVAKNFMMYKKGINKFAIMQIFFIILTS